jgi:hypothetical protein
LIALSMGMLWWYTRARAERPSEMAASTAF